MVSEMERVEQRLDEMGLAIQTLVNNETTVVSLRKQVQHLSTVCLI